MGNRVIIFVALLCLGAGLAYGASAATPASSTTSPAPDTKTTTTATTTTTEKPTTTTTATTTTTEKPTTTTTEKPTTTTTEKPTTTTTATTTTTETPTTTTTEANTTTVTTTTTTPATTTTTHEPNTTTTNHTTTTTNMTTVTTTEPPTTTPIPEEKFNYNVTDKSGITCVIFEGSINFTIVYEAAITNSSKTSNKTVSLVSPAHPQKGIKAFGSCAGNQNMTLQWAEYKGATLNNVTMNFSQSKDNKTWSITSISAGIVLDDKIFEDAVDAGKTLNIIAYFDLSPATIAVNNSYSCKSNVKTSNVTSTISDKKYNRSVTSSMDTIQIQAYNKVKNVESFGSATTCSGPPAKTSNIIPIVVGCCLGGLVVIVLIAYLVSRRRQASNESTA